MDCRKIKATVSRRELRGVVRPPSELSGIVERRGSPIVDGWYSGGVRQTRQFQQVLEELRLQHQPKHWASWALDGSLEEDAGRYPLGMAGGHSWTDVGPRRAVKFDGSNGAGLYYGTDEDFAWVHEERVFTVGGWFVSEEYASTQRHIIGTNSGTSTTQNGFAGFNAQGRAYFDLPHDSNFQRFVSGAIFRGVGNIFFYVWTGTGTGGRYNDFVQGIQGSDGQDIAGTPRTGHTWLPLVIGYRSPLTVWNCFITSQVLTDAEIYALYVAGMQELMG